MTDVERVTPRRALPRARAAAAGALGARRLRAAVADRVVPEGARRRRDAEPARRASS